MENFSMNSVDMREQFSPSLSALMVSGSVQVARTAPCACGCCSMACSRPPTHFSIVRTEWARWQLEEEKGGSHRLPGLGEAQELITASSSGP